MLWIFKINKYNSVKLMLKEAEKQKKLKTLLNKVMKKRAKMINK